MKQITSVLLALVYLASFTSPVLANDEQRVAEIEKAIKLTPNLKNGKQIYLQTCSHCHARDGHGLIDEIDRRFIDGYFPIIAGQHKNVLIKQLADIRAGNRDNPQMYPFTMDKYIGGAQGIADVAAYLSSLNIKEGANNIGPGRDLDLGAKIYHEKCSKCHGKYAQGNNKEFQPRLQGQHYNYMLRQFRWIRDGRRRNANKKMAKQIHNFSYREMIAVIDYVSRMKKHEAKK